MPFPSPGIGHENRSRAETRRRRGAGAGKTRRDRERRQAEIIHRPREAREPLDHRFGVGAVADIAFGDGGSRRRRNGRQHDIDTCGRCKISRQRRAAPAHRLEIRHPRYRKAILQPHQHLRAVILRALDHPSLVEGGGFGSEHQLARRGELALVRQFDRHDLCALALQRRHRLIENARGVRVEIVDIERGRHADRQSLQGPARRRHVIRHRAADGGGIVGVRTCHQA